MNRPDIRTPRPRSRRREEALTAPAAGDGWSRVKLGEVCEIEMGQSPEGSSYNADGNGEPLLNGPTEFGRVNPTAIQWTTAPTRFCSTGDILLCVRGATTGKKNIADRRYCIGRGLAAIRGASNSADTEFLWFALDVVTAKLLSETAGSTFPNLPGDKLARVEIPLPPLAEQRRIAGRLREQMAEVERARAAVQGQLDAAGALPAAVLRAAFENGEAKSWQRRHLGDFATVVQNGIYKSAEHYGHGQPFVRMYNVSDETWVLKLDRLAQVQLDERERTAFALRRGDLLVSRVNSFELVGKCGWVGPEAVGYVFENMLIRVRLNDEMDSLFVGQQMMTKPVREQVQRVAKRAIGQASINSEDLRKLELVVPALQEQRTLAARLTAELSAATALRESLAQRLAAIERLPAALLRTAFNPATQEVCS